MRSRGGAAGAAALRNWQPPGDSALTPPPPHPPRSKYYDSLGCKGAPVQTVANYLGCIAAPDNSISYKVACINASAFSANYYHGLSCAGAIFHAQPVVWEAGCTGTPDGAATTSAVCVAGAYTPPARAINTFFYTKPAACPVAADARFSGVVSVPLGCLTPAGSPTSYLYGCDKSNVTATPFAGAGCVGKPKSPPFAIGPLGCEDKADGASFTVCDGAPPAPAKGLLRAPAPAAASRDAVGDAVAAGLARATELLRAGAAAAAGGA